MIEDIIWSNEYQDYVISTVEGQRFLLSDMKLSSLEDLFQRFVLLEELIIVRSVDRNKSSDTSSSYTIKLPSGYYKKNVIDVQLHSCNIPNTPYNVTSKNNIFKIGFGVDPSLFLSVVVPERNYTIKSLCTMITSLVQNEGNGEFSMKVSESSGKVIF